MDVLAPGVASTTELYKETTERPEAIQGTTGRGEVHRALVVVALHEAMDVVVAASKEEDLLNETAVVSSSNSDGVAVVVVVGAVPVVDGN